MYDLLAKLIIATALLQLGMSVSDFKNCHSRQCAQTSKELFEILQNPVKPEQEDKKSARPTKSTGLNGV
jgi:hypothetical protein